MSFYQRLQRMKVKSRLKAAFRRKPRPARVINRDDLMAGAEIHSDKGYQESTHERQAEFAKNRNYQILKLIKYRDAGMNTYTYFWVNEQNQVVGPYHDSEQLALEWKESNDRVL